MDERGLSVRVAESTIGLDRAIQKGDEERRASDGVAKANRRDSAHVAKKEVKSSFGRKGRRLVPRKILSLRRSLRKLTIRETPLAGTEERAKDGWGREARRRGRRIDRVVSLERSKRESRWPKSGLLFMPLGNRRRERTEASPAASIERRRRATLLESRGENESNERRPRRTSAARARSQAKVDKGSPSRTDRPWMGDGGVGTVGW